MARPSGRRRRKQLDSGGEDEWLGTYADAMTILMAFFVLLFAMSDVRDDDFARVTAGIIEALAGTGNETDSRPSKTNPEGPSTERPHFEMVMSFIVERLDDMVANGTLAVRNSSKGIVMEFNSSTLYRPGSAEILDKRKPMLNRIAKHLYELRGTRHTVVVEGHTDDTPINTLRFPSNWELSTNRATEIVRYFISRGVPPKSLKAAGYADVQPKVANRQRDGTPIPSNRALNRRIVIRIEHY